MACKNQKIIVLFLVDDVSQLILQPSSFYWFDLLVLLLFSSDLHAVIARHEPGADMSRYKFIVLTIFKAWTIMHLHANILLIFKDVWFTSKHGKVGCVVRTDVHNGKGTTRL